MVLCSLEKSELSIVIVTVVVAVVATAAAVIIAAAIVVSVDSVVSDVNRLPSMAHLNTPATQIPKTAPKYRKHLKQLKYAE